MRNIDISIGEQIHPNFENHDPSLILSPNTDISTLQILGGYLSDRFGAERVLLGSVLGWGLLTFWFHQIVYFSQDHDTAIALIVLSRVMMGAFQGNIEFTTTGFYRFCSF